MKNGLGHAGKLLITLSILASSSCGMKERLFGGGQNAAAPGARAPSGPRCPNGSEPKILKGDCPGAWSLAKVDGKNSCQFKWGPAIECPAGTKALGVSAVCYGTTGKTPDHPVESGADCEKQFGQYPQSPAYVLTCCES